MNQESLVPGIALAIKHELTLKEMYVLIPFIKGETHSNNGLADVLNYHPTSLHHILQRLKLKKLIIKDKVIKNAFYYRFNKKILK